MNTDSEGSSTPIKITLVVIALVVIGGLIGWALGRSGNSSNNQPSSSVSPSPTSSSAASADVKSLVSYTLPDGWKEGTCPSSSSTAYIIPNGTTLNCSANPSSPIKIYVDPKNSTDCQQLKPTSEQGIKKHICSSLFIDGHKSLKALTEVSSGSTVSDYFINTGKGVVAVEYTYTSGNGFQEGFDQLANSIQVKG
jgi:hypothetical protein